MPRPFSARSRIHEYGGGEFFVAGDRVYFVNDDDQQVYEMRAGVAPRRVTDQPGMRFGDFALDARRQRLIAVGEQHHPERQHPENMLVAISLDAASWGRMQRLLRGQDFYASPRLSPDGAQLAYVSWSLPDMPWDESVLAIAEIGADGNAGRSRRIAGGKGTAASEPVWLPNGHLVFLWDRSGFDNLCLHEPGKRVRTLYVRSADFGRPLWSLGNKSFAVHANGQIGASYLERGEARFGLVDAASGELTPLALPLRSIEQVVAHGDGFMALATRFAMKKLFNVAPGAFRPPPKVESAVVRLVPLAEAPDCDQALFEKIVREAFSARRKTLRNALPLEPGSYAALGIDPQLRPENLSPADYVRITKACAR